MDISVVLPVVNERENLGLLLLAIWLILTGLVRGDNDQGFTLNTNALGGPFVRYEDLADAPKSVPAVGTRIKQGAQWTGLVALAIAFVPIFLPLMFLGVMSDC